MTVVLSTVYDQDSALLKQHVLEKIPAAEQYLYRMCYNIGRKIVRLQEQDQEEIIQNVAWNLFRKLDRYDPTLSSMQTWVSMHLHRNFIDVLRKKARSPKTPSIDSALQSIEDAAAYKQEEYDDSREKLKNLVNTVMRQIDEKGLCLQLHCRGLTSSHISKLTETPEGTVKSHIYRGVQTLQALLTQDRANV